MKKITLLFICLLSVFASAQPGAIDLTFNTGGVGPDLVAYATINQPDGKILVAGAFDNYNGVARSGIARINADGSLDTTFNPGTGLALSSEFIYCMALQSDGKIMIGGTFASFNGVTRANIARLNADGSVDTSFDPGTGTNNQVVTISLQSTGKIIAGGLFTTYNSAAASRLVRLNTDGTRDTTFNVGGAGPNSYVWTTSVLPDDRIYIGGGWSTYNGVSSSSLLRLTVDGVRDPSYTNLRLQNNAVLCHAVQPDGKIVIGGYFTLTEFSPLVARNRIARVNNDGTLDNTFVIGTGLDNYPLTMLCQPDGKIVVGGAFLNYNGTTVNRLVRLNTDGSRDTGFVSGTGMSGIVYSSVFRPDGKLLFANEAVNYNGNTSQPNLTKINAYAPNAITFNSFSTPAPYCTEATFLVNFSAAGYYTGGNVFTAQLSDAAGSFASPVAIGTLNGSTAGDISVTIPLTTPNGSGYRIRVVSSDVATIGTDNGSDFAISGDNTYYLDSDNDGFGNPANSITACGAPPAGYVASGDDCDDDEPLANPGLSEILYDGIDNNCDGNLDEGFQITTSLLNSVCNTTLASLGSLIGITTIAPGPSITGYRIRATNGLEVQTIERSVPHFSMTQFPSHAYATTYTIEIELQRNGVWLGYYGPACSVSTPAVLAEGGAAAVNPSQCGTTLAKINTLIATTSLAGVTGYRFRVTNLTDPLGPNAVQTLDRSPNWFSLQMLTRYNYGTTYRIEVAVKTTGDFGGYGTPCEVSSPATPALTVCGGTVATTTTAISTTSLLAVTQYRFLVTRQSDNASATVDRNVNWFNFTMIPALNYTPGAVYSVSVAVMTAGTWSPYGNTCEITAPGGLGKGIAATTTETNSVAFKVAAYPNPFNTDFNVDITASAAEKVQIKVYDMLGRLIESTATAESIQKLGSQYPSGVYNVVVSQGEAIKTLRVIKR